MRRGRWFVMLVVALPLVLGACDWSQFGFNAANTSSNPSEPALTSASVQHLEEAWSYDDAGQALVANGRVITRRQTGNSPAPDSVHTLDVGTGEVKWSTTLPTGSLLAAVGNGLAYFGLDGGGTATVEAATGAHGWTRPEIPLLLDGTQLFVESGAAKAGASEQLVAVGPNGATAWSVTTAGEVVGAAAKGGQLIVETHIPVNQAPGAFLLLSTYSESDGALVRQVAVAAENAAGTIIRPSGLVDGGDLVYLSPGYPSGLDLFAVDPVTGKVAWHVTRSDPGGFALTPNTIVATTSTINGTAGQIIALSPKTGAVQWTKDIVGRVEGATVTGNLIFVGHQWFDPLTGMLVYDLSTGALVTSSTTVCCGPFPSAGHVFGFGTKGLEALVPSPAPG